MSAELLRQACLDQGGFEVPELNSDLMLEAKGLEEIPQSLVEYPNLKVRWIGFGLCYHSVLEVFVAGFKRDRVC